MAPLSNYEVRYLTPASQNSDVDYKQHQKLGDTTGIWTHSRVEIETHVLWERVPPIVFKI